ncbi:Hpt domain-containing protein [Pseudaminobacter arsenicus]|uniref:Hpt domain-containing protein n=2 Tax=Borborobacter arsenicus TaxID=1851146 RepID=A0A432V3D3_9HYPH|nr:Hpt domain-containing protein [Pseudaminobacter arsenicus]
MAASWQHDRKFKISSDPFSPLRLRFLTRCRDHLATLKAVKHSGGALAATDDALVRTVHSLSGAGGTFGFHELSERAYRLETLLLAETKADPVELGAALDALIQQIEIVLE